MRPLHTYLDMNVLYPIRKRYNDVYATDVLISLLLNKFNQAIWAFIL